jgi:hypothetical protein
MVFSPGDRVCKRNGNKFTNGEYVATIAFIVNAPISTWSSVAFIQETETYVALARLEHAKEFIDLDDEVVV